MATTACEARGGALPLSFDLTTRVAAGNRLAIMLHLFREGICILTRRISVVDERDAALVLARCGDSLERRGCSRFVDGGFTHPHAARRTA